MKRIVSFLPAGTEIAYAVGAAELLVGRSHECDYPPQVKALPIVSRPALSLDGLSQGQIDRAVAERLRNGDSLYEVHEVLLRDLAPDVVLTQDLCQVGAPPGTELTRALKELPSKPNVLWLTPKNIAEIEENILEVGAATSRTEVAESLVAHTRTRMEAVRRSVEGVPRRRVVFLEWTDPPFCRGPWVPGRIAPAAGDTPLRNSRAYP